MGNAAPFVEDTSFLLGLVNFVIKDVIASSVFGLLASAVLQMRNSAVAYCTRSSSLHF